MARVLDLTRQAAVYATRLLAEQGHEVIRVEAPAGDAVRRLGPFLGDVPDLEDGAYHQFFNAGKRSLALDVTPPRARGVRRLILRPGDRRERPATSGRGPNPRAQPGGRVDRGHRRRAAGALRLRAGGAPGDHGPSGPGARAHGRARHLRRHGGLGDGRRRGGDARAATHGPGPDGDGRHPAVLRDLSRPCGGDVHRRGGSPSGAVTAARSPPSPARSPPATVTGCSALATPPSAG